MVTPTSRPTIDWAKEQQTMKTFSDTCVLCLFSLGVFLPTTLGAQDISYEGELELTARHFLKDGALPGQIAEGTGMIGSLTLAATGSLPFGQFATELHVSKDERSGVETFDLPKAYLTGDTGRFRWLAGNDIVFWGVAESFNPVNIVNQRSSFASAEDEDRLGQPMVMLSFDTPGLGNFSLYGLLGFRELDNAERQERLRFDAVADDNRSLFESDTSIDLAFRNSNTLSTRNGSLDYAVSVFSGRERQPVYLPGCSGRTTAVTEATCAAVNQSVKATYEALPGSTGAGIDAQVFNALDPATQAFLLAGNSVGAVPYYQDMHQIGLELVYATGPWQLKFEGAQRFTERDDYFSGVIGAEYDFGDLFGTSGNLTAAAEYIYDTRSELQPSTFLDNDIFAALQYDFNNFADTSFSISGLKDVETDSLLATISVSWRLSDKARFDMSSTRIVADDPKDPLSALNSDDFFEIGLSYFF